MNTKRFSRTLAMLLALMMVLGMLPVGAAAAENAEIVQWNVTLRDNLQANFYLSIPDTAVETATVNVSVGGKQAVSCNASALAKNSNGYYCVSAFVAAAQMTDEIKVSVLIDGTESVSKTYTLAQYGATVLAKSEMKKYHDVVLNMLNYGANAQLHFNHNADALANAGHELESTEAVPSEQKEIEIDGAVDGIVFDGATLLFQDRIATRYYFTAPNGVDSYTFTVDGQPYEIQTKGSQYYIQVNGYNPQDYSNEVTVTVSDGTSSQSITYSPMHYITRMYNKTTTSQTLKDLLTAMYGYHVAVCNLPDLTPEELGYTKITMVGLGIVDGTQSGNLVNNKLVEGGLDMKYLDADVSFDAYEGSTGIKYGATAAGSWNGIKIGLTADGNLSVNFTTSNYTAFTITPAEAGVESFSKTFNLKFASKVSAGDTEDTLSFVISMWINDVLVLDHLLVGNMKGLGDYVGILTWGAGKVTVLSQQTPEEMGYTRYTMADLGVADGSYADNAVRGAIPEVGVNGGYLDVDVAFTYLPGSTTADSSTGVKIGHTGPTSWDGLRIALADGDKLTVKAAKVNAEIFTLTAADAGVETFTETFNLKVATKMEDVSEGYKNVTISLWINDKLVKKNVQTGGVSGIGDYAGILTWFGAGITVASPVVEVLPEETEPEVTEPEVTEPEVTEPEVTEPEVTEPEVTEPEVTEPEIDPTPEELGYTRYTLEGIGIADGTYNTNKVTCAVNANGLNNAYLDVDVSFSGVDGSSGIKIANTAATSWDGIRIGLADGDKLTVRYTVTNLELKTFAPADVGLTTFSETFNLKVATKVVDSATEGAKDVTLSVWINNKLVINHMLIGGVTGIGNYAGVLSWNGASITVMSKQSAAEMGYTRYTLAGLGIADGTYNTNAVTCAENANGLNNAYLDVDVSFSGVDGSSGIKIANTAATSWDGIRIGLADGDKLTVRSAANNGEIFTLTTEEAGIATFTETFNLKVATKIAFVSEGYHNVTISLWINDKLIKKNVQTGGIKGIGNFAGILSWNGASITVASQVTLEELGYTRITLADLGIADGTYNTNAVTCAENANGLNNAYLDVDVAFNGVDGSSGIKIANTAAGSWDGIRIGLADGDKLTVRSAANNGEIFTLTTEEAGIATFTETFNLKVATKIAFVSEGYHNVTISLWINDKLIKKNVQTGGIKGIGNFAGILSWNGASITVATPA